jgi:AraC family transcriptional regulator, transcriptional activator of the genes for pyochelin and ferripyochelin receptors
MTDVSHSILLPKQFTTLLGGDMIVSTGETEFQEEKRVLTPFKRGLTAAITLEGRMSCRIDDRPPIAVEAPSVSLVLSASEHRREQVFAAGQTFRYALVHLSAGIVETHVGVPLAALLAQVVELGGRHGPVFITAAADQAVRSLAAQIMVCPLRGLARDPFLLGKSLELAAYALERCLPAPDTLEAAGGLSASEVERLTEARDILVRRYAEPLSVPRLAAAVGLNTKTLGIGFRRLFGTGIPEFLQEYRLQLAYNILAAGEAGVAETAYRVGYTPAYLSTLFRNRFGVSPREMR